MAAITSAADGTWVAGAATTWTGGVAPAEGDTCTIQNTHDVEIDNDITVGADTTTAAIQVAAGGSLFVPNTVAGNYTLTCKGDLKVAGTFNIGTVANPIPAGTTFTIKLNYSASLSDGEFGLIIQAGGTFTCQGSDPWGNGLADPDRCLLAADTAVNDTALTVSGAVDWNANDYIAIAPTRTTYTQYERGQVDSCSGTTLNVKTFAGAGGGVAFVHDGDSPIQAEIINLTRNIVIMNYDGVQGTPGNVAYVVFETTSTVDVDWTEFRYLGENAADKYGITIKTTSGSCNLNRCSFHQFEDGGLEISGASANNWTIQNCVSYFLASANNRSGLNVPALTNATWIVNNLWMIGTPTTQSYYIRFQSILGTITNLRVAGVNNNALYFQPSFGLTGGTVSDILSHSNSSIGIYILGSNWTGTNFKAYHNNYAGIEFGGSALITLNSPDSFGNNTYNFSVENAAAYGITLNSPVASSTSIETTTYGFSCYDSGSKPTGINIYINDGDFGTATGIRTAHGTSDIKIGFGYGSIYLNNTILASATEVRMETNTTINSFVAATALDQTAGNDKRWIALNTGSPVTLSTITPDTSYYATASPSQKLTPNTATGTKMESGSVKVPVASGNNPTITVKVRESAALNGNAPRLMVRRNDALGITADAVLDTATNGPDADVAPGTWETLSGQPGAVSADGVIECYVDVDGTAGFCGVDDWSVTGNI